jgi:hypothetical protein
MPRLDTAYVAGLFADRSRVAMFDVLMDTASAIRDSGDFSQLGSKPSLDDWFAPGA